ncbi:glycosyltransferase family 2 protein [Rhizobium sp. G21]|uniref:glycosyltransferase family 2 protein n=1 Tax=Rhizobium sp. G21 TaxID=2758439 RepID=UPI001601C339|nr:glycosyltransferase family 2 protein [Rhizobium sp. G21]MBB1250188.1 glycosyltransferase family 2 protein [Rhizobium sp. G21]
MTVELSIAVPVYNEEDMLVLFLQTVTPILESVTADYEIVFVNDGSRDATLDILTLARARDPRIKVVDLSRNFGKEAALTAALAFCSGRAVIPMDVDLQDPPGLIPVMVEKWREGFDVVLARRADRSSDAMLKRWTSSLFYKTIGRLSDIDIPADAGDFRLMDRRVVDALGALPERARFMKGLFAWLGYRQATVDYVRPARAAGSSKWKPLALWRLGLEGIVSFSSVPLKLWSYIGLACALAGFLYGAYLIGRVLLLGVDVPGYASLASFILFFNGLVLTGLGVVGEYVARIFIEVKGRPLFLVRETWGLEAAQAMQPPERAARPESLAARRA